MASYRNPALLAKLKEYVETSYQAFESNQKRFRDFMRFVFDDALNDTDREILELTQKPDIQFNSIESYISRLLGEFAKQVPGVTVKNANDFQVDPMTVEVVHGILRTILKDATNHQVEYKTYREQLGGGYSAFKIWTEYGHERDFEQRIRLGKVDDPTMMGFDPLAREPHKQDGQYCFELYPLSEEDFKSEYPDEDIQDIHFTRNIESFNWNYRNDKQKVVLLCDFYQKERKRYRIHKLSNGQVVSEKEYQQVIDGWFGIEQPPAKVQSRWTHKTVIYRYVFMEDRILSREETQLPNLPLIFVDGNSVTIADSQLGQRTQVTRPYAYHVQGTQQLKNYAGQSLAAELQNMMQSKYIVDKKSIPLDQVEDWINPQKVSTLMWQSRDKNGEQLAAPIPVQRSTTPPIIAQTFELSDGAMQHILGSYDAQLGLQKSALSGIAIENSATQNNAVAMPYIVNFMAALTAAAQMIVEMLPLYYSTPRTIQYVDDNGKDAYKEINQILPNGTPNPMTPQFMYPKGALNVSVEAGYNFEVQKERSLKTIIALMGASEGFKAMMEQEGLPMLVENLDIKGSDKLLEMSREFTERMQQQRQMEQQQGQMNPQMQLAQAEMELKQQDMALREQKMKMELAEKNRRDEIEAAKLQNEKVKIAADVLENNQDHEVAIMRAQTERDAKAADVAIQHMQHLDRHADAVLDKLKGE